MVKLDELIVSLEIRDNSNLGKLQDNLEKLLDPKQDIDISGSLGPELYDKYREIIQKLNKILPMSTHVKNIKLVASKALKLLDKDEDKFKKLLTEGKGKKLFKDFMQGVEGEEEKQAEVILDLLRRLMTSIAEGEIGFEEGNQIMRYMRRIVNNLDKLKPKRLRTILSDLIKSIKEVEYPQKLMEKILEGRGQLQQQKIKRPK